MRITLPPLSPILLSSLPIVPIIIAAAYTSKRGGARTVCKATHACDGIWACAHRYGMCNVCECAYPTKHVKKNGRDGDERNQQNKKLFCVKLKKEA